MARCRGQFAPAHSRRATLRNRSLVAWIGPLVFALAGCTPSHFTPATMPATLHVPPANPTPYMDVAGMIGPGTGTNEISPGDLLEITVFSGRGDELEKEPIQVRVTKEGTVDAPPIGPVPVAGLEPFAAEQQIARAAMDRGILVRPSVTVQVLTPAVNRITVLGAVEEPGVKEIPKGSCDLARAIAAAGGLTDEAGTKVDVVRYGTQPFLADTASPHAGPEGVVLASYNSPTPPKTERIDLAQTPAPTQSSHALGDRDVVMVLPQEKQFIHVTGLVRTPNQFELPRHQDVTVMDAIALAGGVSSPVADRVYVIRRIPSEPEPVVIEISIREAKQNGNENLRLAAGDLVSVERTMTTMCVDTVMSLFRVGVSVGGNLVAF